MTSRPEIMERLYWLSNHDWYVYHAGTGFEGYTLSPEAPERAKQSFEEWKKHYYLDDAD